MSRLYLECNDPTEYTFAVTYLESWDHWQQLCACNWFKVYLTRWREELEVAMKSRALANIMREAKDKMSKNSFAANKFIVEKGWEPKDGQSKGRGRPSKDEITAAAYDLAETNKQINDDMARLTKLVN